MKDARGPANREQSVSDIPGKQKDRPKLKHATKQNQAKQRNRSNNSHIHLILPITLSLDGQNPMSQNPSAGAPVLGLPRHHLPVKIDPQLDQILPLFLSVVGIKSPIVQLLLGPKQEQGVRAVMHPVRRTPFLHDETA